MSQQFFSRSLGIALFISALCALPASAKDVIVEKSFLRDDTRMLSLDGVQAKLFTPYAGLLNQGFQRKVAYWVKLKINAANPVDPPYVLRVRPNWHDDIRLFDPTDPHQKPRVAGDRTQWSQGEFPSLSHSFLLTKMPVERDVYLRIDSAHTYLLDVEAIEQSEAARDDWRMLALYITHLGLTGMVFLWAIVSFILRPEPVIGTFSLSQFSAFFYCLLPFGIARIFVDELIPAVWLDLFTTAAVFFNSLAALVFHRNLLAQYSRSRWILVPIDLLTAAIIIGAGLFAFGETTLGLWLNASSVFAFSFVLLLASWFGLSRNNSSASHLLPVWAIRLFCTVFFLIIFIGVTPVLGVMQTKEASLNIFLIHSAVTTVLMGSLLFYRARRISDRQMKNRAFSQQRAKLERQARMKQNQFMSMLNHEIKTPLSVLKLLVTDHHDRELAEENIDTISMLLERCLLSDRIDAGQPTQKSALFCPAEVVEASIRKTEKLPRFEVGELSPVKLVGDPEFFSICVANLLDNALKYGASDSAIRVGLAQEAEYDGQYLCLYICNDIGRSGIPDIKRAFEKYYRADSARSNPGTGLGLYLVKSLADLMGARVSANIDNQLNTISFKLCLPL